MAIKIKQLLQRVLALTGLIPSANTVRQKVNCMIIGAAKSGTTSLYNYLSFNPDISTTPLKEIHYFDWNYEKPEEWYEEHFKTNNKYRIEATPYYIFHPQIPARVHAYNPDCKFIVILRNPIDRAISHYFHNIRLNTLTSLREDVKKFIPLEEKLPITDAFSLEEERIHAQYKIAEEKENQKDFNSTILQHFSYKARGRYAEQLQRWYKFFPKENFLLIDFEDLSKDPKSSLIGIYDFLGIRESFPKQYEVNNKGEYEQSQEIQKLRKELEHYFDPYDKELVELTNRKFKWMKD